MRLREKIQANPRNNLKLIGFFRLRADENVASGLEALVLGDIDQLLPYVEQHRVDEVIIATNRYSEDVAREISTIMYELQRFAVAIRLAPDYSEISFFHVVTENFEGLPLIGLRTPIFSPAQRLVKRWVDLTIALAIGLIGLPIFAAVALAIRLESEGPIILRQRRIGIHGKPFSMYKFRSMYNNIDQNQFDETKLDIIKRPDDPRVTRVGRFLRRTSLDEMPQFLNVIKGDMSLVGPRPELPDRVQEYVWWQFKRFEVPQGMTGWWQINGRANRPMHLNTEDDLYYIQNYSLWLDAQILWRTIKVVFTGEGAF
jgi:exopolysaccharide biosynthesis polyprenyl glycosylphosphotransferase